MPALADYIKRNGTVVKADQCEAIHEIVRKPQAKELLLSLPDVSDLCEIRFSENRKNGGFTEATLTLKPDGTGENAKKSKYDGPEVYKSVKRGRQRDREYDKSEHGNHRHSCLVKPSGQPVQIRQCLRIL